MINLYNCKNLINYLEGLVNEKTIKISKKTNMQQNIQIKV